MDAEVHQTWICISIQACKDVIKELRLMKMFVSGNDQVKLIFITCC